MLPLRFHFLFCCARAGAGAGGRSGAHDQAVLSLYPPGASGFSLASAFYGLNRDLCVRCPSFLLAAHLARNALAAAVFVYEYAYTGGSPFFPFGAAHAAEVRVRERERGRDRESETGRVHAHRRARTHASRLLAKTGRLRYRLVSIIILYHFLARFCCIPAGSLRAAADGGAVRRADLLDVSERPAALRRAGGHVGRLRDRAGPLAPDRRLAALQPGYGTARRDAKRAEEYFISFF